MSRYPSNEAGTRRVVVTGVGVCAPGGSVGRGPAWERAERGEAPEAVEIFPGFSGFEVQGFDASTVVDRRKALKLMGPNIRFALGASREAWEASGREPGHADGSHAGIVLGTRTRPTDFSEYVAVARGSLGKSGEFCAKRFGREGADSIFPLSMLRGLPNLVTAQVTIQLGLHGFSDSLTSGEISGLQAIGEGHRVIRRGDAEVLLAGGADDLLDPVSMGRLISRPRGDERVLPFSQGAAMVVLEEQTQAVQRGAHCFAEVLAVVEGFSAEEDAATLEWTWHEALERAGRNPGAVAAIWLDARLSGQEDRVQEAAKRFQRDQEGGPRLLSEARRLGDLGAATGALEASMAIMALETGRLPGAGESPSKRPELTPEDLVLVSSTSVQGGVISVLLGRAGSA